MMVYVVVADYGLNGAGVLAVFPDRPTPAELEALVDRPLPGKTFGPRSVTGYGGIEVQEVTVS